MLSSSRIIKSVKASSGEVTDWVIDTAYDYLPEEELEQDVTFDEATQKLKEAKQKSSQLIERAQTEKEKLMEEAQQEIDELKQKAYEEAYEKGQNAGFERGFSEGQSQGFKEGQIASQELLNQARQMIRAAQLDIEQYIAAKKESLLSLSVHMAEKIVQEQLDLTPDGILELVHPILHQLDRKEDYVSISVHPSKRKTIRDSIPDLEKNYPGVRFVVFGDDEIDPLGCIVESAHKLVDLQVKKQLEAMVEEMKEREREM
ncbi:Flagellar assembly protein FliH [Alkalibacterium sp. AK22]|uniref:FliH/SctL family protein n=1 Tax=Alkalibacterium sp. AK22 TaxID=1229520 RepID=UPI0004480E50|nr:FliH/SctL family protein [Alkalibacterium sp. AK22]EXJ22383.1 Flagellar assembly protein FliH [Alkalibacterium sp. AK22]